MSISYSIDYASFNLYSRRKSRLFLFSTIITASLRRFRTDMAQDTRLSHFRGLLSVGHGVRPRNALRLILHDHIKSIIGLVRSVAGARRPRVLAFQNILNVLTLSSPMLGRTVATAVRKSSGKASVPSSLTPRTQSRATSTASRLAKKFKSPTFFSSCSAVSRHLQCSPLPKHTHRTCQFRICAICCI